MLRLDDKQSAATESSSGRSVVVAPPGSGKTRVLVERVARLVGSRGLHPDRIAVLTFTRAAADEFRSRLRERLVEDLSSGVVATTFHGLAFRYLSECPEWANRREGWTLWDEEDALAAARRCAEDAGSFQRSKKRAASASFADLLELPGVEPRYRALLATCNALDFEDLATAFLRAVEEAELLGEFDALLVDEYQDTSPDQVDFISSDLLGAELFVVGDPRQSIYSFRGATPEEMLRVLASPDWTRFDLGANYRSTSGVVQATNLLLGDRWPFVVSGRETARVFDDSVPEFEVWDNVATIDAEAERVVLEAKRVVALGNSLRGVADIGRALGADVAERLPTLAVVARSWNALETVAVGLAEANIPFRWNRKENLFSTPGGRFHLRVLRAARNPRDDWSAELVARSLEVDERDLLEGRARAAREARPLLDLLPDRVRRTVLGVRETGLPSAAPKEFVDDPRLRGYRGALLACADWIAARKRDGEQFGIPAFLEDLAAGWVATAEDESTGDEVVVLTTAHSAKGLEFDVVVVVGVSEGSWPSARSARDEDDLEEDLRLLYVAATRARDRLVLSAPLERVSWGTKREPCLPSRFLAPLLS